MQPIHIMVNGMPGNMASLIASHALADRRFSLVPYSLTGPEITSDEQIVGEEMNSVFGSYQAIDKAKVETLNDEEKQTVATVQADAKKGALMTVAIFPLIMLACYLFLIFYFKSKGGYTTVELEDAEAPAEPAETA